jgi:hypothetical protein
MTDRLQGLYVARSTWYAFFYVLHPIVGPRGSRYAGGMRVICAGLAVAAVLAAQDTSSYRTTAVDINGNRVAQGPEVTTSSSKTGSGSIERMQSINGRMVPVERTEERVVREDASGKVTERTVHHFDATGKAIGDERVVIEERKGDGGNSTMLVTKYGMDVNGRSRVTERTTTQIQTNGGNQTSDTVVERATMNDSLQTVEKQTTVVVKQGNGFEESATTYRRSPAGDFYEAARRVTDHSVNGDRSTDNTAEYEVGATGRLELHGQTVTTAQKRADGSQDVQVDIFGKNVPGVVNDGRALQLKEHQIVERRASPGGSVVETLSVQRPTMSDPTRLGPPRQISETVCRGKCDGSK